MTKMADMLRGDNPLELVSADAKDEQRYKGKIIRVDPDGWGFISSKEIAFTRIFFHWTSLQQNTLNFKDLKKGMNCEFTATTLEGKGTRAIKIKVLTDETKESTKTE
jgi:'Cold-shock' DNA-binding domain